MALPHDILLDDAAFTAASSEMNALKTRADTLKKKLEGMYKELTGALDTPAGKQVEATAKDVLIKPIDDMLLVIKHVSETLSQIIGTGHYKDVFIKFEELNQSMQAN
jgi:hypothetical protein